MYKDKRQNRTERQKTKGEDKTRTYNNCITITGFRL